MESNQLDRRIRSALVQISEGLEPPPGTAAAARKVGERRQRRVTGQRLILTPVVAMALFFLITAFPVFAGQQNLYQWWAERELAGAAQGWTGLVSDSPSWQVLGVTAESLANLEAKGLGRGEIAILEALTSISGRSTSELLALWDEGLGWGKIAAQLGVDWQQVRDLLNPVPTSNGSGDHGFRPDPAGKPLVGTPTGSASTGSATGTRKREREREQQIEQEQSPSPQNQEQQWEWERQGQRTSSPTSSLSNTATTSQPETPASPSVTNTASSSTTPSPSGTLSTPSAGGPPITTPTLYMGTPSGGSSPSPSDPPGPPSETPGPPSETPSSPFPPGGPGNHPAPARP